MSKQRNKWTTSEMKEVAEKVFELYSKDTDIIWRFVDEAQSVLPPERRKSINGKASISNSFIHHFEQVRKQNFKKQEVKQSHSSAGFLKNISTERLLVELALRVAPIVEKERKAKETNTSR